MGSTERDSEWDDSADMLQPLQGLLARPGFVAVTFTSRRYSSTSRQRVNSKILEPIVDIWFIHEPLRGAQNTTGTELPTLLALGCNEPSARTASPVYIGANFRNANDLASRAAIGCCG